MDRPRISTVVSAALASAAAFYVITRSGLAGTLAGAAVASLVYTATSHGVHTAAERFQSGRGRAAHRAAGHAARAAADGPAGSKIPAPGPFEPSVAPEPGRPGKSGPKGRSLTTMVTTWAPVLLACVALLAAVYSLNAGTPPERVVVHERVVEKPMVTERIVVQTNTVTVTQPAQDRVGNASPGATSTSTTVRSVASGPSSTTTTAPVTSTTSTTTVTPPVPTTSPATPAP